MFADSITVTFATTNDLVLTKRAESNYSSEYFGTIGLIDFKMSIKHTLPKDRLGGETSHMVRLDATEYNSDNEIIRTFSVWRPFATQKGRQDNTLITQLNNALGGVLSAGNVTKLLNGES